MKSLSALLTGLLLASIGFAQPGKDALKKVEAVFEPAEAKPGQTVSLKITVSLANGYNTYPAVKPSPAHRFNVNKFAFTNDSQLLFVGELIEPTGAKSKKDEDGELLYFPGGGTWTKKVVVSPQATAGNATGIVKLRLLICDENNCFPPKAIDVEAPLKVLAGPAVPVEKAYLKDVEKALKK